MRLHHLKNILDERLNISELIGYINTKFTEFDLVSTEVDSYIVTSYAEEGVDTLDKMQEKKQLFMKQTKKIIWEHKNKPDTSMII